MYYVLLSLHVLLFIIMFIRVSKKPEHVQVREELPSLLVLVPVYNEEQHIYSVLQSIFCSDYPLQNFSVMVINDGSQDESLAEIHRFIEDNPKLPLQHLSFPENRGKRAALIEGIAQSTSELIVFIDSDTYPKPDAFRLLAEVCAAGNFAVCGEALVENVDQNLLCRIQAHEYNLTYNLFKLFESSFGVVTCLPGCFSMYHTKSLQALIPIYSKERIFNFYGEDRFLTALSLKQSTLLYLPQAQVTTRVPEHLGIYARQRIRWFKDWLVNSVYLLPHMLRQNPILAMYYLIQFVMPIFQLVTPIFLVYWFWSGQFWVFGMTLLFVLSVHYFFLWKVSERFSTIPMLFFGFSVLIYPVIFFRGLLSLRYNVWGTR